MLTANTAAIISAVVPGPSYEGLCDSLADKDEMIEAKGKLERVVDNRTAEEYYRVLVGSPEGKGQEYIKRIP
jgi:predicted nucleotidyltransferase